MGNTFYPMVSTFLYADNLVLLAEGENELQCSLYSLNIIIQNYNRHVSSKKLLTLRHSMENSL